MKTTPHILITRPTGQHLPFVESLTTLGLTVSHLPCLEIQGLDHQELRVDPAIRCDSVLFTSVNAVWQAHRLRPLPWPGLAVYAIGAATFHALEQLGQPPLMAPMAPFNTESFLQQIAEQPVGKLLLVKGEGGRGLLGPGLQNLGWQVDGIDVYRRRIPRLAAVDVERIITCPRPDIISITSNESLHNFVVLAAEHLDSLYHLPLVVNSARAAELAQQLGFTRPAMVASPAGDQGQLSCVDRWYHA